MAKVQRTANSDGSLYGWAFKCPGCDMLPDNSGIHVYTNDGRWTFNNNEDCPTFSPSLLNRWHNGSSEEQRCHLFLRDGKIEYCGDSTHSLAGQTVECPEWK